MPEQRQLIQQTIDTYSVAIARSSEPDTNDRINPLKGEGKKELLARACS
jgi:hypothetical protein